MLFIDPVFLFVFAPIAVIGFWVSRSYLGASSSLLWMIGCSLFFYGYNTPYLLIFLILSYCFNYMVSRRLSAHPNGGVFAVAITVNLAYLGYFKYTNFFLANIAAVTGKDFGVEHIALPLGISFYTFQQIVYISDAYRGHIKSISPIKYMTVNSFFPHLVAGPIIWHREIAPQLERSRADGFDGTLGALGLLIFSAGLFKKVVIADNIAVLADSVFDLSNGAHALTFVDGWLGAFAYAMQIYFDFAGYSEMAIGLALLFGIRFPINFFSPYKATSIIEFWRRWHMTMTRFFQEFVYMPLQLSANRRFSSVLTNYAVIIIMMLLVGVWHGAGWTWIAWGVAHGVLLCCNHLWRHFRKMIGVPYDPTGRSSFSIRLLSWALTFGAVSAVWVLFRAASFESAGRMYHAMFMLGGFRLPDGLIGTLGPDAFRLVSNLGLTFGPLGASEVVAAKATPVMLLFLASLIVVCATFPNLLQVVRFFSDGRGPRAFANQVDVLLDVDLGFVRRLWAPSRGYAWLTAFAFMTALVFILDDTTRSVFIYFNF